MIKITRNACPQILIDNEESWRKELSAAKTKLEKTKIRGKYKHKKIKNALEEMCHKKCVYCESKLNHIAYGHIEHFRPFSLFQELCFSWGNLFLSCEVCNGKRYKSDNFPLTSENEGIVNPEMDEPGDHLEFEIDPETFFCYVVPKTERGVITEQCLGLNRIELVKYRTALIKKLIVLGEFAKINDEARNLIREATQIDQPYLAFIRKLSPKA
jgi:uncharacterized protein (TIGR02646 family)